MSVMIIFALAIFSRHPRRDSWVRGNLVGASAIDFGGWWELGGVDFGCGGGNWVVVVICKNVCPRFSPVAGNGRNPVWRVAEVLGRF